MPREWRACRSHRRCELRGNWPSSRECTSTTELKRTRILTSCTGKLQCPMLCRWRPRKSSSLCTRWSKACRSWRRTSWTCSGCSHTPPKSRRRASWSACWARSTRLVCPRLCRTWRRSTPRHKPGKWCIRLGAKSKTRCILPSWPRQLVGFWTDSCRRLPSWLRWGELVKSSAACQVSCLAGVKLSKDLSSKRRVSSWTKSATQLKSDAVLSLLHHMVRQHKALSALLRTRRVPWIGQTEWRCKEPSKSSQSTLWGEP